MKFTGVSILWFRYRPPKVAGSDLKPEKSLRSDNNVDGRHWPPKVAGSDLKLESSLQPANFYDSYRSNSFDVRYFLPKFENKHLSIDVEGKPIDNSVA